MSPNCFVIIYNIKDACVEICEYLSKWVETLVVVVSKWFLHVTDAKKNATPNVG